MPEVLNRLDGGAAAKRGARANANHDGNGSAQAPAAGGEGDHGGVPVTRPVLGAATLSALRARLGRVLPPPLRSAVRRHLAPLVRRADSAGYGGRRFFVIPHNRNSCAIRLNVIGREPAGCVRRGAEFDAVSDGLARELGELVHPETGRRAVAMVVQMRREFPDDPLLDHLPDLLVVWDRTGGPIDALGSTKVGEVRGGAVASVRDRTGDHSPRCLLLARGAGVRAGLVARGAPVPVEAIAPTIAALEGVSFPGADAGAIGEIAGGVELRK
jgi:hypothetical protein